jgi:hypothetical protein
MILQQGSTKYLIVRVWNLKKCSSLTGEGGTLQENPRTFGHSDVWTVRLIDVPNYVTSKRDMLGDNQVTIVASVV